MQRNINISLIFLIMSIKAYSANDTLTLSDAIQLGLENNYSIKIEANNNKISSNNNTLGNAGFYPIINAQGSLINNINNTQQIYSNGTIVDRKNATSYTVNPGISLNWVLFDGFKMFIEKRKYETLEQIGNLNYKMTVENTISNIIVTYNSIIQQKKNISNLQNALNISKQRLIISEMKAKLGSLSELGILEANVDLNQDSAALLKQLASIKNTKATLNKLLNRNLEIDFEVENNIFLLTKFNYQQLLQNTLEQNSSVLLSEQNELISGLEYKLTHAPLFPKISIFSGYTYNITENQVGFMLYNKGIGFNYGINFSYPLFNGTNNLRNIKNSAIKKENASFESRLVKTDVESMIYELYNNYEITIDLINFAYKTVELSVKTSQIAFEKFKLGEINDIDFRLTQLKQLEAEQQLIIMQYEAKQYETELMRLSGNILR